MDNFDLRKFLVENKLTTSSRQLDELDIRKGIRNVAAGVAMLGAVAAHGQLKPQYKAKIDSIQKTALSPQEKRAEIQKIVQLNRDEISGKHKADFLKSMAASGFTDEEEYKKYLAKNAKKADAGLDGMQGPNFNSGKSCGIAKAGDRENRKDWSKK